MIRLLLSFFIFLLSLLVLFGPPFHFAWYLSVAVSAYTLVAISVSLLLLVGNIVSKKYKLPGLVLSGAALVLFCAIPVQAYFIAKNLPQQLAAAYGSKVNGITGFQQPQAFSFSRLFTGTGAQPVIPKLYTYTRIDTLDLELKFYPSTQAGTKPCLVVVHGGAWNSGSFDELPEEDNYYANAGYQVASINYRLAPQFTSPAPVQDVKTAIDWLTRHTAELQIDTNNFVLLGRSAGGQIALAAAYTLGNPNIRGIADYYGPTDMIWSYDNPASKRILDSKALLEEYYGGTPTQVREKYLATSPTDLVTPASVPTLMIHGGNDAHVSPLQPVRLSKLLSRNKVPHFTLTIPWASHGCQYHLSSASGQLCVYATERFFWAVTH